MGTMSAPRLLRTPSAFLLELGWCSNLTAKFPKLQLVARSSSKVPRSLEAAVQASMSQAGGVAACIDLSRYEWRNFEATLESLEAAISECLQEVVKRHHSRSSSSSSCSSWSLSPEGLRDSVLSKCRELEDDIMAFLPAASVTPSSSSSHQPGTGSERHLEEAWTELMRQAKEVVTANAMTSTSLGAGQDIVAAAFAVHSAAVYGERRASPSGYLDRPTGTRRVRYLLSALEAVARNTETPVSVAVLNMDILTGSLFADERGARLLALILRHMQSVDGTDLAYLRFILHTSSGSMLLKALALPEAGNVIALPDHEEGSDDAEPPADGLKESAADEHQVEDLEESSRRGQAQFEWQMNEVLGHPAMLKMREISAASSEPFAVIMWESIRHLCKMPYVAIPMGTAEFSHPLVQAMVDANLLSPRWGPSRLVIADDRTRERLLCWIDAQHAKLSFAQRLEYNMQLVRRWTSIASALKQVAK